MVTSAGDEEKYTAGFTILKHAATGLILIGIAWFIVSIIFWLVNILTQGATTA
jgi:preprotein translocase subunit Sss1